jgi:hypothetical protein
MIAGLHLAEFRRMFGDADGERDFLAKAASARFGARWESLTRERLAKRDMTTAASGS